MGKSISAASRGKTKANTKTVAYDVSEQLRTPEEMAAYLDAWLVDAPDDAAGIARALGDIARAKGMSQVARNTGLSREHKCTNGVRHDYWHAEQSHSRRHEQRQRVGLDFDGAATRMMAPHVEQSV